MTRTDHFPVATPSFPIYSCAFVSDREVVFGGGGGASRSGVKNKLRLCRIDAKKQSIATLSEYELAAEEDTPMTMAISHKTREVVAGINSAPSLLQAGTNTNCRVFALKEDQISLVQSTSTFAATFTANDDYPYQKVTSFSRDGSLLAIGSTNNQLSVLSYPALKPPFQPVWFNNVNLGDLYDADFSDDGKFLAATTSTHIYIYAVSLPTPTSTSEKEASSSSSPSSSSLPELKEIRKIHRDTIKTQQGLTFRAVRFGRGKTSHTLYAALNAPIPKKKGGPRKAFVATFEVGEEGGAGWKLTRTRVLAGKPVTVFDISDGGHLLAYGCSDLSVGIIDSETFGPLLKILKSHELPPTALKFSPSADLLLSASVDNTVRVIVIPSSFAATYSTPVALLFLMLFLAFLAVVWQARQGGVF